MQPPQPLISCSPLFLAEKKQAATRSKGAGDGGDNGAGGAHRLDLPLMQPWKRGAARGGRGGAVGGGLLCPDLDPSRSGGVVRSPKPGDGGCLLRSPVGSISAPIKLGS